jgi:hypothetical protein
VKKSTEKNREDNLIPWVAGQSGNPNGRPANQTNYRYQFNRILLEESTALSKDGKTAKARIIARRVVDDALKGKPAAYRIWMEQAYQSKDFLGELEDYETRGEKRDQDFLHYRLHKAATDVQRTILFSRAKYIFAMAGRRGGKTKVFGDWFGDEFIDNPGARCLYIGLTLTTAMALMWTPMIDTFTMLGLKIKSHNRVEGMITTEADGVMKFGGNTTQDEREKNRGPYWDRVVIDECQSQKQLRYLVESIISPTLLDKAGQLALGGTGPRVRGTYWEELFLGAKPDGTPVYPDALRLNWNLTHNPFIPDHENQLAIIRKEKNLEETDPLYIREYLGRIAYDDDALVLRLGSSNSFDDAILAQWINSQPVTDIRFSAGLDFGFEDADALAIIAYSVSLPERFLVYEWKANRTGTADIAAACNAGIAYVKTSPIFAHVVNKDFYIHADTSGNRITPFDLANTYGIPVQAAYNQEKEMAFELLQDETRRGIFKVRKDGPLWDESLKTIYKRNERDELTREIDDETYHPDQMRAVHYAMRPIQLFSTGGA